MRWDDTKGLIPASIQVRARGLFAKLERTKTSGPDKTVTILPIFLADEAYISQPR